MALITVKYTKLIHRVSPFDEEREQVRTKSLTLPARLVGWWLSRFSTVSYDDNCRMFGASDGHVDVEVRSVTTVFRRRHVFLGQSERGYVSPDQWDRQAVMKEIFRPILKMDRFGKVSRVSLVMPSCQLIDWQAKPKEGRVLDGEFTLLSVK